MKPADILNELIAYEITPGVRKSKPKCVKLGDNKCFLMNSCVIIHALQRSLCIAEISTKVTREGVLFLFTQYHVNPACEGSLYWLRSFSGQRRDLRTGVKCVRF